MSKINIDKVKLPEDVADIYEYDNTAKKILADAIKWLEDGGDYNKAKNPNAKFGQALTNKDIKAFVKWKEDSVDFVNHNDNINNSIVAAISQYGRTLQKPLYRGVSKKLADSMIARFENNNNIQYLKHPQAFSSDYETAERFANENPEDDEGAIMKLDISKPVFYIEEFLFLIQFAKQLLGIEEINATDALEYIEYEHLLPKSYKFKYKGLDENGIMLLEV